MLSGFVSVVTRRARVEGFSRLKFSPFRLASILSPKKLIRTIKRYITDELDIFLGESSVEGRLYVLIFGVGWNLFIHRLNKDCTLVVPNFSAMDRLSAI